MTFSEKKENLMKKEAEVEDNHELEIVKAVAQAWYGRHSSICRPTNEFDAHRRNFKSKPTRFKLEAMKQQVIWAKDTKAAAASWDFGESLWDAYEIVAVSKRLENAGIVSDSDRLFSGGFDDHRQVGRRRRESKHSLRNLFSASRRFNEFSVSREDDTQF